MAPGRYQLEDTISLPGCASPDYSANAKSILRMRMNTRLTTCVHGIFLEPLHTGNLNASKTCNEHPTSTLAIQRDACLAQFHVDCRYT